MTEPGDLVDLFGKESDEDKEERFEESTLKMLLQQLGATPAQVRKWRYEEPFNVDWFNDLGVMNSRLYMKFFRRVSMVELIETPSKSELVQFWINNVQPGVDPGSAAPAFLIYDTAHFKGRKVCTNVALPDRGHIHVAYRTLKLNITPFSAFFAERYGPCITGDLDAQ
jgi:hypothetical protein